jgi:hypothetical protein
MTNKEKINENFSLSYNSREDGSGDTVMDVSVSFDNPKSDEVIKNRLNTWLQSIGRTDLVVCTKTKVSQCP